MLPLVILMGIFYNASCYTSFPHLAESVEKREVRPRCYRPSGFNLL